MATDEETAEKAAKVLEVLRGLENARVHRAERHYGRIHRAFRLPADVGQDPIKAAYKDGVLEVN